MSPEAVADFLRKRASQSKDEAQNDPVDESVESALRSRGHLLIDLALARYGRYMSTVTALFQAAQPSHAVRLAALSNRSIGLQFIDVFNRYPTGLFPTKERAAQWIDEASPEELQALFENPNLDDSFLRDVLERSNPWESISDERLATIVAILARNERMRTRRQDDYMDGYAEYSYGAVFNTAWKLAEIVEPTEHWAMALGWLYDQLEPDAFSIKNPMSWLGRWQSDTSDAETVKKEVEDNQRGWLSNRQRVRKGLGRLMLRKDSKLLTELLDNDDVALRCAAYSAGQLTPEQLTAAYQRDGELAYDEAIRNTWLWRSQPTRAALKDMAWSVVRNDKHSDLLAANLYNSIHKDVLREHPDWFRDEEDEAQREIDASNLPATRADIAPLTEQMRKSLQTLNSRTNWIWWFSLGALVASLKHF
jgi:hypothetical protein